MTTPSDIPLPQFLDPLLDYLSSILPPQLYSFLITLLSHSLAVLTGLFSLLTALVSSKPWEWDAQTVLPPLISFLAAYLALVSVYRTTSWMFRTSVWFIKWGSILGALAAAAGWYMGSSSSVGRGGGLVSGLGGLVLDMINGQNQNAAGGSRSRPRSSRVRSQPATGGRPKPWDTFSQHREWQYQENQEEAEESNDVQKVIGEIVGAAGRVVREGGWWEAAKGFVDSQLRNPEEEESAASTGGRRQPPRKARAKTRNSRSR